MGSDTIDAILAGGCDELAILRKIGVVFHFAGHEAAFDPEMHFSDIVREIVMPHLVIGHKPDGWTKPLLHIFMDEKGMLTMKVQIVPAGH